MLGRNSSKLPQLKTDLKRQTGQTTSNTSEQLIDYLRLPEIKRLVHRLVTAQNENNFTSLAIVSLLPKEGRTFFVSLLALAYATVLKKRVLILDTVSQSREASLHLATVMRNSAEHPTAQVDHPDIVLQGACGVDLVTTRSLKPEGLTNDSSVSPLQTAEFLMRPFLSALAPSYDLILLDTCPLEAVTTDHFDPLVLARQVDQVMGLVSPSSTTETCLLQFGKLLQQAELKLLGVVRNLYKQA